MIVDNKVYDKPFVLLQFSNKSCQQVEFLSLEKAVKYKDEIVEKYIKPQSRIIL